MNYEKLIQPFCDGGIVRPNLKKPYVIGEYVYATDYFCMCRMKTILFDEHILDTFKILDRKVPMDSASYFNHKGGYNGMIQTNCLKEEHFEEVDETSSYKCQNCDGNGYSYCDCCGQETDCKDCNGSGYQERKTGRKIKEISKAFGFFEAVLAGGFFKKVDDLAIALGVPEYKCYSCTQLSPVLFEMNDNIEVLVMPLRHEGSKQIIISN